MDKKVIEVLEKARVIAVVGLSDKFHRPSYQVAKYLQETGYRIIPVNPGVQEVLGQKSYPDLLTVPEKIDIVDVFRRSEEVLPIAEQAIKIHPICFWMQEGVKNEGAKELLESHDIFVVMDMCIKIEHHRFLEKL